MLRLLEAAPGLKYKAAFGVAYGAGLNVSEGGCGRIAGSFIPKAKNRPEAAF
jgi:hypothetical protein